MNATNNMYLHNRPIGENAPCFIIAEAGVNHNGSLDLAKQLIDVAHDAGADAVKFQTFKAEKLVTESTPKAEYQQKNTGNDESQFAMLQRLELDEQAHLEIDNYCKAKGILFLSTAFDEDSADLLDSLNMPAFKVGSGELTNLPFLEYLARKEKPLIISTGMAYLTEVEEAIQAIEKVVDTPVALLHCVSNYPADDADTNLRAMQTMKQAFDTIVGYSDHTLGIDIPLAAVAMNASIIEKHFTLDRTLPGPDHKASLEPNELKAMVTGIRRIESAMGNGRKIPSKAELGTANVVRRSIIARVNISANTRLEQEHLVIKRPGNGLPSNMLPYIVGRVLRHDVNAGDLIQMELFD
jgi:N,N'-diacetyllegionaminate synthase